MCYQWADQATKCWWVFFLWKGDKVKGRLHSLDSPGRATIHRSHSADLALLCLERKRGSNAESGVTAVLNRQKLAHWLQIHRKNKNIDISSAATISRFVTNHWINRQKERKFLLQLLKCEYVLVYLVFYDNKLNIFELRTITQHKKNIQDNHLGRLAVGNNDQYFSPFSDIL